MRQSKLFTKTIKEISKDELSVNAKFLIKAGFIDKLGAGIYTFLPLGLRVHNKIINIIREEMDAINGQEILMPALIPKENWKTTNRWDNFDPLFKIDGKDKKEYALGATHEEVITPLLKKQLFSYKELPVYVYQIQTKFRNELRAKSGLIRGREFSMKDLYSFHTDENDLNKYYETVIKSYFKIFKRCGLKALTYLTFASGGAFSKYSHEFQTIAETGEDTIYICHKCKIAINKEIIKEQSQCPKCGNKKLKEQKAIEVGNIFKLKDRFSKAFDFTYVDKSEKKQQVVMGCYGIGPSRIMGTIAETSNDNQGIIWPEEIAPFSAHLLSLGQNEKADELYNQLKSKNIEVLFDDRENASAGEKFADADLIGCPIRIVVSKKTLEKNCVEIKKRNSEKIELVKINEVFSEI
ncbi:MAG: aminoacyl--tRNA ligase-related protein [Patescibacteria group bacterium]|nr:aminoacyl--tRNA ligase-related protein [Patescibacteria group bacterium]